MTTRKRLSGQADKHQIQGPRPDQEDFYLAFPIPFGFFMAVMDGHGGKHTAKYCSERIPTLVREGRRFTDERLKKITETLARETRKFHSGSTLSIAVVLEKEYRVLTAVIGDSPILVVDAQSALKRSLEHNARSNMSERASAVGRGGIYRNGCMRNPRTATDIQLTRALGDTEMDDILLREAEFASHPIGLDSIVLVASDGFLDPSHGSGPSVAESAIEVAKTGASAIQLIGWREQQLIHDNITVVVWRPLKK